MKLSVDDYIKKFGRFFVYDFKDDRYLVADFLDGSIELITKAELMELSNRTKVYGVSDGGVIRVSIDDYFTRFTAKAKVTGMSSVISEAESKLKPFSEKYMEFEHLIALGQVRFKGFKILNDSSTTLQTSLICREVRCDFDASYQSTLVGLSTSITRAIKYGFECKNMVGSKYDRPKEYAFVDGNLIKLDNVAKWVSSKAFNMKVRAVVAEYDDVLPRVMQGVAAGGSTNWVFKTLKDGNLNSFRCDVFCNTYTLHMDISMRVMSKAEMNKSIAKGKTPIEMLRGIGRCKTFVSRLNRVLHSYCVQDWAFSSSSNVLVLDVIDARVEWKG